MDNRFKRTKNSIAMKKIIGFLLMGFALQASAQHQQQSDSLDFLVRKRQYSARLGLFNYEVTGEFRVGKKQVLLTSLGLGGSWEYSFIFRKNYKELDNPFLFGDSWFSVYTNVEYRVYRNKSQFGNSGLYLGGKQVKRIKIS